MLNIKSLIKLRYILVGLLMVVIIPIFKVNAVTDTLVVSTLSKSLSTTTQYTLSFVAPFNLTAATPPGPGNPGNPGTSIMINSNYNGPQESGAVINVVNATLSNTSSVTGLIQRMPDFMNSMTMVVLTANVSQGTTVNLVLDGVVNPGVMGQYTFNISINGLSVEFRAEKTMLLGVGQTYLVSGKITRDATDVGVTSASVNANQKTGRMFLNTNADTSGNYSIELPVGEWELRVNPQWGQGGQMVVDWSYSGMGKVVNVVDQNLTNVNFAVISAKATVTGKVVKPDGTPLTMGGIDIRSKDGIGVNGGVNQSGEFTIRVPEGSYKLNIFSQDPQYTAPAQSAFTILNDQTKNFGTITLVEKTAHIKGKVVNKITNIGIAGINVETWSSESGGWGNTQTNSEGMFDLLVASGTWEVNVRPEPGSGYAFESGPPTRITIVENQTIEGSVFKLSPANAKIIGRVVDSSGQLLDSLFAFVMAMEGNGDPPKPGPGTDVRGGLFTLQVPAGTWTLSVQPEPGSQYSSAAAKTVTIADNETQSVELVLKKNDAFIIGTIRNEAGTPITGLRVEVFAENGRGSFKMAMVNENDGTYKMGVIGGDSWHLGVYIESGLGYMMQPPSDSKTTVASGAEVEKDFNLLSTNATITGRVLDPDGNGISNVFVFVDTNLVKDSDVLGIRVENAGGPMEIGGPKKDLKKGIQTGNLTNADGNFSIAVPAGVYGVGSGAPASLGLINPEPQRVVVGVNASSVVNLQYRKSNAKIIGSIMLNGVKNEGFVWAWSEKGGHSETYTRTGDFELNVVNNDVWHIGADFEKDQKFYRSSEYVVTVSTQTSYTQNLSLTETVFDLPPATSQTIQAASGGTIQLENGARLVISAGAFGSSGTYTVTITPTARLTKEKNNRPLAFGYQINAVDSNGQEFTSSFSASVWLILPYTDEMLAGLGVTASDLNASFFDDTSSIWQGVTSFTVNTDEKTIVASIQHFTDFAITTGDADSTPPANPTSVTASAGVNKVTLTWTKPTDADLKYINIYRSTTVSELGALLKQVSDLTAVSYEDTGLTTGTKYYYVLKSIDTIGNISSGTTQVNATPTAPATPTPTSTPLLELPATGVSVQQALIFYLTWGMKILMMGILLWGVYRRIRLLKVIK